MKDRFFYTRVHDIFRKILESVQDLIIIGICGLLFLLMLNIMTRLFATVFKTERR